MSLISRLALKLESAERQSRAVNLQSKLYSQMAAKAVPPGLHCLSMRLTIMGAPPPPATSSSSLLIRDKRELPQSIHFSEVSGESATARDGDSDEARQAQLLPVSSNRSSEDDGAMRQMTNAQGQHQREDRGGRSTGSADEKESEATQTYLEQLRLNEAGRKSIISSRSSNGDGASGRRGGRREGSNLNLLRRRSALDSGGSKIHNRALLHYALFSDNVLAVAVVVNSTAQNLIQPWRHVFHVVTDKMNYAAVRAWFTLNPPPRGLTLDVRCLDDYPWINASYIPVLKQIESESMKAFYFRSPLGEGALPDKDDISNVKYRNPKYLSILNHLRFYLPQIFPELDKILFLDDDVVVQRDLSPLWEIPIPRGKVQLAVETCGEVFHRFHTYLNFSNPLLAHGHFDPQGCGWAFGMNVFDLKAWRAGNYTEIYHTWQRLNENRTLWKLGTLPPGLLTFYNATQPLDKSWQVLGLGSTGNVSIEAIEKAAVIHFNGHAKPWLDLAIVKYQRYWAKYVPYDNELLQACFITRPYG
eukprot:TRINITY_DN6509_c0_g1_i1.p1 TRINITY_DN6509_c0_g1~~TRINITY_DN6509_c0_g1_i1.p1  ORF type:complete len:566 (-),score=83.36 TRINITY_DN6509_c0_g1_i1:1008-2597(-)